MLRRRTLSVLILVLAPCAPVDVGRVRPNDNTTSAGVLRDGKLRVQLVARQARWYPESEDSASLMAEAFGEEGRAPMIPGPLVRVPVGTRVVATVRNALPDTMFLHGFSGGTATVADSIRIVPNESRRVEFRAARPGTYIYRGSTLHAGGRVRRWGTAGQLVGVIVVDTAGAPRDRVFVVTFWDSSPDSTGGTDPFLYTINGKSWPYMERLRYAAGDSVRWRVVNANRDPHAMHLHGFYYRIVAHGTWNTDTVYASSERRLVVTETMAPMTTMSLVWQPERPGNWIFHCHMSAHVGAYLHSIFAANRVFPGPRHFPAGKHATHGMAGLVMGIEVTGSSPAPRPVTRRLRLLVQQRANVYGADTGFGYVLGDGAPPARDSIETPGPPLVFTSGDRPEVTVVNHLTDPTSVHWHGIELESYNDGVPDWSGQDSRTAPPVAPGDSFRAVLSLPRAGTFIYHAHVNEMRQIAGGLYGPLIVLKLGERWNPDLDHVLVVSVAGSSLTAGMLVNGRQEAAPLMLSRGRPHRLRIINIPGEDVVEISLKRGTEIVEWRPIAKDGAELPPSQTSPRPARIRMGPGETADFEIVPAAGDLEFVANVVGFAAGRAKLLIQ